MNAWPWCELITKVISIPVIQRGPKMPANFESVPDAQYMFCTSHSIIYKHIKIIYKEIKGGGGLVKNLTFPQEYFMNKSVGILDPPPG